MSIEHYPCNEIPFDDLFDGRLKRFGITTHAKTVALIAPAAAAFIRKWLKDRQSFHLNLRNSPWAEIFTVMVGIGFFTRTGRHYHMTVPHPIELDRVTDSLLQFAETEDAEYYLHPERHL